MTRRARCLVLFFSLAATVPAFASRWIVKNGDGEKISSLSMFGITEVKVLNIDGEVYRVLEAPDSLMSVKARDNYTALKSSPMPMA